MYEFPSLFAAKLLKAEDYGRRTHPNGPGLLRSNLWYLTAASLLAMSMPSESDRPCSSAWKGYGVGGRIRGSFAWTVLSLPKRGWSDVIDGRIMAVEAG